jgi:hypothetical protein
MNAEPAHGTAAPAKAGAPSAAKGVGKPRRVNPLEDKLHVWPFLVRNEFLALLIVMFILAVWSIGINAPLEEPANPAQTPNPSKAPWYFLGLQEMLVYFDPWIAGVVLPGLIIVGLMVIPFVDPNPKGNGYFTFRERPFAITMYLFGFLILWIALIVQGVFMRGPGWNFFWPWEKWDPHKVVALNNVDLPYWGLFGTGFPFKWMGNPKIGDLPLLGPALGWAIPGMDQVEILGLVLCGGYYLLGAVGWFWMKRRGWRVVDELGPVRYGIVAFLFLSMMSLPIKMFLRIFFNIKYVWVTPWFNI